MAKRKNLMFRDRNVSAQPEEITPDPESVVISAAAAAEMHRQARKRGADHPTIRVGIRGGGCSGYTYVFDWEERGARENDHVIQMHDVSVFIDPKSMKLLQGTILDFVATMMNHGFKFRNPNAKGTCGCGESVQF